MSAKGYAPDVWAKYPPGFWEAVEWYEANGGGDTDPPESVRVWGDELHHLGFVVEVGAWACPELTDRGRLALRCHRDTKPKTEGETEAPAVGPGPQHPAPAGPRKPLTDWREIAAAVGMLYADRKKIIHLNRMYNGPIEIGKKGSRPFVYSDELRTWWDAMDAHHQEQSNQDKGRKLEAEAQYNYGRDGTAAPEIGGGVKKRRSDRRT